VWTEARAAWNGREMPLDAKAALATQTTALRTFQYEVERAVEVDG
jgi:hypothetical protein